MDVCSIGLLTPALFDSEVSADDCRRCLEKKLIPIFLRWIRRLMLGSGVATKSLSSFLDSMNAWS